MTRKRDAQANARNRRTKFPQGSSACDAHNGGVPFRYLLLLRDLQVRAKSPGRRVASRACPAIQIPKGVSTLRKTLVALLSLLTLILVMPAISVAQSDSDADKFVTPMFTTDSSITTVPETSKTVPHWTSSLLYNEVMVPSRSVCSNASSHNSSTP